MLLDEYYRADPELRDVWIALPGTVRAQILQWDARVTTKGELSQEYQTYRQNDLMLHQMTIAHLVVSLNLP